MMAAWVANGDYRWLPIAHMMRVQIAQSYARMTGGRTANLVSYAVLYIDLRRIRRPPLSTIK
jgi:hypothetical protein